MSNAKDCTLAFEMDFDFGAADAICSACPKQARKWSDQIRQLQQTLFAMTGMPGVGLRMEWQEVKGRQNRQTGGWCSRFQCVIRGTVAFSWDAFEDLRLQILNGPGRATIQVWSIMDRQN